MTPSRSRRVTQMLLAPHSYIWPQLITECWVAARAWTRANT